jgi:tRNA(adenine34) deaminase
MKSYSLFLEEAYKQAIISYEHDDVPVGAIIEKNGLIIAKGRNKRILEQNAILHAEIDAIQNACKYLQSWRLDNCTMYITLEPCLMCTGAIIQSRINNIVFASLDAKNGCVLSKHKLLEENTLIHKVNYEYYPVQKCSQILSDFFLDKRNNKIKKKFSSQ